MLAAKFGLELKADLPNIQNAKIFHRLYLSLFCHFPWFHFTSFTFQRPPPTHTHTTPPQREFCFVQLPSCVKTVCFSIRNVNTKLFHVVRCFFHFHFELLMIYYFSNNEKPKKQKNTFSYCHHESNSHLSIFQGFFLPNSSHQSFLNS